MSGHSELQELLGAVALGAATPEEAARVAAHAEACAECRAELAALRGAADALALAPPPAEPPPALRGRVLAAVRAEAREPAGQAARPAPVVRPAPRRRPGRWPALAAALGAACLALLGWNLALRQDQDGARVDTIAVAAGAGAPGVRGEVVWVPQAGAAVLRLDGLPDPGPGRAWRLWAVQDGVPRSLGSVTATGRGGAARAGLQDLRGVQALALTPERPDHAGGPTSTPAVQVVLPA